MGPSASITTIAEGVIKTMLVSKSKTGVVLMLSLGTLAVAAGVLAQPKPAQPIANGPEAAPIAGPDQPKGLGPAGISIDKALAKEQLDLVQRALDDLYRSAAGGEIRFGDAAFSIWGRRKLESLRSSGAEKSQIVAELEKYLAAMKKQEEVVAVLSKRRQSTRVDVMDVHYRRLEAEIWLDQEKAR